MRTIKQTAPNVYLNIQGSLLRGSVYRYIILSTGDGIASLKQEFYEIRNNMRVKQTISTYMMSRGAEKTCSSSASVACDRTKECLIRGAPGDRTPSHQRGAPGGGLCGVAAPCRHLRSGQTRPQPFAASSPPGFRFRQAWFLECQPATVVSPSQQMCHRKNGIVEFPAIFTATMAINHV